MPVPSVVAAVVGGMGSSAALPSWSPLALGAMILVTLVLVIIQAVRYFRNNRDD